MHASSFLPNDPQIYRLTVDDGNLCRVAGDPDADDCALGMRPLSAWLEHNEADLRWLIRELGSHTIGIFPGIDRSAD
jgi:hypothetical protein